MKFFIFKKKVKMIELAIAAGVAPWVIEKIVKKIRDRKKLTKKEEEVLNYVNPPDGIMPSINPPPNPFAKENPTPAPDIPFDFPFYDPDMENTLTQKPHSSSEKTVTTVTPKSSKSGKGRKKRGGKCIVCKRRGGAVPGGAMPFKRKNSISLRDLERFYLG